MADEALAAARKLHDLCSEALEICGDDWRKIVSRINAQVGALPTNEQNALRRGVSKIVGYEIPMPGETTLH